MTHQLIQYIEEKYSRQDLPEIKPGMVVRVWQKFKEKKGESLKPFEGIVISLKKKKGTKKMFTVRGEAAGQMVEKTYPFNLPTITKIEILKQGKTKRAKLYFIRKLHPRKIKRKLRI
ncbi:MAG: 50S ribosomal protein L19 [Candidatus Parcubacteria bacterium]|nr:MAG: 50S ribosomal protein L19 [Candidatus Parcubacteria bacterium]